MALRIRVCVNCRVKIPVSIPSLVRDLFFSFFNYSSLSGGEGSFEISPKVDTRKKAPVWLNGCFSVLSCLMGQVRGILQIGWFYRADILISRLGQALAIHPRHACEKKKTSGTNLLQNKSIRTIIICTLMFRSWELHFQQLKRGKTSFLIFSPIRVIKFSSVWYRIQLFYNITRMTFK